MADVLKRCGLMLRPFFVNKSKNLFHIKYWGKNSDPEYYNKEVKRIKVQVRKAYNRRIRTSVPRRVETAIRALSVRFEVFTAVTMKNGVFWVVTPRGSCKNRRFGGTWRLLWYIFAAYVGC
jgi:hypothetical protein